MITLGFTTWVRDKFFAPNPSYPAPAAVTGPSTHEFKSGINFDLTFDYQAMNKLLADERVYAIVHLAAVMVRSTYQRVDIMPKDIYDDTVLDDKEKKAINIATQFVNKLDIKELFFTYAWNMIAYGDYVEKIVSDSTGITDLVPMPINNITILSKKTDVHQLSKLITEKNFYVLNEEHNNLQHVYPADQIVHVSFNSRGLWRKDIRNRETYSIYSVPPIAPLRPLLEWKKETIKVDMKWKRKMVPRDHWVVNIEDVTPQIYPGSQEEKLAKAKAEIDTRLNTLKGIVDTPEADQSVITTQSITRAVSESSKVSYTSPNDILMQINGYLGVTTGVPDAYLGGSAEGYAGLSSVAIINSFRTETMAEKIKMALERVIHKHLGIANPELGQEVIDRVVIKISATTPQVELEKSKLITNYASAGILTPQELREKAGYGPTSQKLLKAEMDERKVRDSEQQIVADERKAGPERAMNNNSPKAESNQLTKN